MFQYKCCFGGIASANICIYSVNCFNTSVVSVESVARAFGIFITISFQYKCCFGGIFNKGFDVERARAFQYKCCFGGINHNRCPISHI